MIRSRYALGDRPKGLSFSGPSGRSRTKQSFRQESDVNTIVARAMKGGALCDSSSVNGGRVPLFGDFSNGADFLSVQNRIASCNQLFSRLSASVRARFGNSPAALLDFISDEANASEAQKLGLLPVVVPPTSEPLSPVVQTGTGTPVTPAVPVQPELPHI